MAAVQGLRGSMVPQLTADGNSPCPPRLMELQEVMDFFVFARKADAPFIGMVVFKFVEDGQLFCTYFVVVGKEGVQIHDTLPDLRGRPAGRRRVEVTVSIDDFLFLYSGAASTSEVASMCLSGRISVPWLAAGSLRSFADSFDFSSEMWDDFYQYREARGALPSGQESSGTTTTRTRRDSAGSIDGVEGDWQLVRSDTITCMVEGWQWIEGAAVDEAHPAVQGGQERGHGAAENLEAGQPVGWVKDLVANLKLRLVGRARGVLFPELGKTK